MNIFNKIQLQRPGRSNFDLSHDLKLSCKMGYLIPTNVIECVPGDKFRIASEGMYRMMPMINPIMHKVDITQHHFFVPNRILWDGWEAFITGAQNSTQGDIAFPTIPLGALNVQESTLADYMGLPLGNYLGTSQAISALPFAAYHRIWWEWYRDQNLQQPGNVYEPPMLQNGSQTIPQAVELLTLRKRAWEHDYFTSCLPFAQKGDPVELPLDISSTAEVVLSDVDAAGRILNPDGSSILNPDDLQFLGSAQDNEMIADAGNVPVKYDPNRTLQAEFDDIITSTTINDLRASFSLQKWLEKNARGGSRMAESIYAHFGVRSSDQRLSRPEYLGGSKASMAISEVLQTSQSESTPQGTMAGHGIGISAGRDCSYFCEEHGYIITVLSIKPKTAYMQGLPKHFSKNDRLAFYWPDFAFLGEEPVLNKELYMDFAVPANNNETFGYLPRFSEYRYIPSRCAGAMRTSLDSWHMARKFDTLPALNSDFIQSDPTTRIFAVEDPEEDHIIAHIYHKIQASRPLPKYGNPGSI